MNVRQSMAAARRVVQAIKLARAHGTTRAICLDFFNHPKYIIHKYVEALNLTVHCIFFRNVRF